MPVPYNKNPLTTFQLYDYISNKQGLICNKDRTERYLNSIGYYRLSKYFQLYLLPTPNNSGIKQFKNDTTLDDILDIYKFDRKLRLIVLDVVEKVEVLIRSNISNLMSKKHGTHWFSEKDAFGEKFQKKYKSDKKWSKDTRQEKFLKNITYKIKKTDSYKKYKKKYNTPDLPPSWILIEKLTLGDLHNIYINLKGEDKSKLAKGFDIEPKEMESLLRSVNYIRNICAHHDLLWNRKCTIKPTTPKKFEAVFIANQNSLYTQLLVLNIFLRKIINKSNFVPNLLNLFAEYNYIPISLMGFHENWEDDDFWKLPIWS